MLLLVESLLRVQILFEPFVVPRRDRLVPTLLGLAEILLDVECWHVFQILLHIMASWAELARFFEFRNRRAHLRLLVASDGTGVRKCAANTSCVLFLLAAFVRSQVLKTSEPCCFILVFFAYVSEHLRLSYAALHLCENLQLLVLTHHLRTDKIVHRLHDWQTRLNSIDGHCMHLLCISEVHSDLAHVALYRWHKHPVGLHDDLVDAALNQVRLHWHHLRMHGRIIDGLEVLDLSQLLELAEQIHWRGAVLGRRRLAVDHGARSGRVG